MSAHNVNLRVVLSDANRIIKANRRHFLALSLLFVLPLSLSVIVYPSLSKPTPSFSSYNGFLSSSFTPVPDFRDLYFMGFVVLLLVLIGRVMIYFHLEWYVVESKWGYVVFAWMFGIMSWFSPSNSDRSVGWMLVIQTVAFTGLGIILRLYGVAATAVLFIRSGPIMWARLGFTWF